MKEFEINDRINILIERLNITPYEFSKKMGNKRPDGLYKILKNEARPTPKTLGKIKEVFPEYYSWLLTGEGSMFREGSGGNVSGDVRVNNGGISGVVGSIGNGNVMQSGNVSISNGGGVGGGTVSNGGVGGSDALLRCEAQLERLSGQLAEKDRQIAALLEAQAESQRQIGRLIEKM